MNNENFEETFQQIKARLDPVFSELFEPKAMSESGGYLNVALQHKRHKTQHTILRIGRKEIAFIQEGRMRRQYNQLNDMQPAHLKALTGKASQ